MSLSTEIKVVDEATVLEGCELCTEVDFKATDRFEKSRAFKKKLVIRYKNIYETIKDSGFYFLHSEILGKNLTRGIA